MNKDVPENIKNEIVYSAISFLFSSSIQLSDFETISIAENNLILRFISTRSSDLYPIFSTWKPTVSNANTISCEINNLSKIATHESNSSRYSILNIHKVEYEIISHNGVLMSSFRETGILCTDVKAVKIRFIKANNEKINPVFTLRFLAGYRIDYLRLLVEGILRNNIALINNPFHISADFINLFVGDNFINKILLHERMLLDNNQEFIRLPDAIKTFYNNSKIAPDVVEINRIEELNDDLLFGAGSYTERMIYFMKVDGAHYPSIYFHNSEGAPHLSSLYISVFDLDIYTLDLIHKQKTQDINERIEEVKDNYVCLFNGPFFAWQCRFVKLPSPMGCKDQHGAFVGARKFRPGQTFDGLPIVNNGEAKQVNGEWITGPAVDDKYNPVTNKFISKVYVENIDSLNNSYPLKIERGLLSNNDLTNSLIAFESPIIAYLKTDTEEINNLQESEIDEFISQQNNGRGTADMPFFGVVEKTINGIPKKYLLLIVYDPAFLNFETTRKQRLLWLKTVIDRIGGVKSLVFPDGAASTILHYKGKFITEADRYYHSMVMPCCLGVIEKSKL